MYCITNHDVLPIVLSYLNNMKDYFVLTKINKQINKLVNQPKYINLIGKFAFNDMFVKNELVDRFNQYNTACMNTRMTITNPSKLSSVCGQTMNVEFNFDKELLKELHLTFMYFMKIRDFLELIFDMFDIATYTDETYYTVARLIYNNKNKYNMATLDFDIMMFFLNHEDMPDKIMIVSSILDAVLCIDPTISVTNRLKIIQLNNCDRDSTIDYFKKRNQKDIFTTIKKIFT